MVLTELMRKSKPIKKARAKANKVAAAAALSTITFTVAFYSGAGGIYFHGEGIPDNQYISSTMKVKSFSVQQTPGHQIVTVSGSAPSSGKLTVTVSCGTKVLSPASENTFDKMTFGGFIVYDI